jgi:histidinol phosphatase-like enzyme
MARLARHWWSEKSNFRQSKDRLPQHPWRKPNPGMIHEAGNRMNLDLPSSWIE